MSNKIILIVMTAAWLIGSGMFLLAHSPFLSVAWLGAAGGTVLGWSLRG